eukprot:gb/GEZN01012136.1/.p1 GENE.gb/GEZN01012136.1/~~gb/GEZN01012136.1/.p1  ORF type:complete len:301 (+),score=40.83 gb/GEZN01012136.1/:33-905(+)
MESKKECADCGKNIEGWDIVVAGKRYHHDCFSCSKCNRQFEMNNLRYTLHENKAYCSGCMSSVDAAKGGEKPQREYHNAKSNTDDTMREIQAIARMPGSTTPAYGAARAAQEEAESKARHGGPSCTACGLALGNGYVSETSQGPFHEKCFKCGECNQTMGSDSGFTFKGKKPYHSACLLDKCGICGRGVKGQAYKIDGQKIHKDCFKCAQCDKDLAGGHLKAADKFFCSSTCKQAGSQAGGGAAAASPAGPSSESGNTGGAMFAGTKFCPECGANQPKEAKFCAGCGEKF